MKNKPKIKRPSLKTCHNPARISVMGVACNQILTRTELEPDDVVSVDLTSGDVSLTLLVLEHNERTGKYIGKVVGFGGVDGSPLRGLEHCEVRMDDLVEFSRENVFVWTLHD